MSTDKLDMQSPDLVNANIEKLAELFPNCVTESADGRAIDFDLLKQELNHTIIEGTKERYRLEWPGKKEAIVTANIPTTKTLRPVREDSVDFDNTENIYIEGDNLEVLKLLQESYLGKIKLIYIDPPYNTGKDFVYKDNFAKDTQEELIESGQKDEYNQRLVVNPETAGRYHSDWLSMMYPRLKLAKNLLLNDGLILISIDDNEIHNISKICDEIFGEQNFVGCFIWRGGRRNAAKLISTSHEYMICYAKNLKFVLENNVNWKERKKGLETIYKIAKDFVSESAGDYHKASILLQNWYKLLKEDDPSKDNEHYKWIDKNGVYFASDISRGGGGGPTWEIKNPETGQTVKTPQRGWAYSKLDDLKSDITNNLIHFSGDSVPCKKRYLKENEDQLVETVFYKDRRGSSKRLRSLMEGDFFDFPKDEEIIAEKIESFTVDGDLILDFFSGSATTAHSVLSVNAINQGHRKFILVQIPEEIDSESDAFINGYKNICEIGKERIKRASNKIRLESNSNIDYGFRVYRLEESNMRDVYYRPQDYNQDTLDIFADNVKPDRTADDLLAQVMLDWGLPLSLKIEQVTITEKNVYKVAGDSLYACFELGIDEVFAKEIAKDKPLRIVFRDSGFANDTAKVNVKQLLKQLSPETEMKVF
jgi:adenine-specific DNA-methyltransferase